MNTLDTEFHRLVRKRIDDERDGRVVAIISGQLDEPEYKRQCGFLQALKQVADWCDQIESDMRQGK